MENAPSPRLPFCREVSERAARDVAAARAVQRAGFEEMRRRRAALAEEEMSVRVRAAASGASEEMSGEDFLRRLDGEG